MMTNSINISESGKHEILLAKESVVSVGEGLSVQILEKNEAHKNFSVKYYIGKNAKVIHGRIMNSDNHCEIYQNENSSYELFSLYKSSSNDTLNVHLTGKDSVCDIKSVAFLDKNSSVNAKHTVFHEIDNCKSSQLFKAVLNGKSKSEFRGNIIVQKNAYQTEGTQLCKTLLLSDESQMNAVPELSIMNDDVKCSHGNAIGSLDENAIFYLCSRGLSETEAKELLIDGFVREIIDLMEQELGINVQL